MSRRAITNGALITAYTAGNAGLPTMDLRGHTQVVLVDATGTAQGDGSLLANATQLPFVVSGPGQWTFLNAPAANVIPTATKAAGAAGVRHVLQSFAFNGVTPSAANLAAAQPVYFVVRDGATGAGTILFQLLYNGSPHLLSGLNIVGSAATAMTIELTAAPGLTNFACVSGSGYSVLA